MQKRGKDLKKIFDVIEKLEAGEELPIRNRDHALTGDWIGFRDCHIEPDWILIYAAGKDELILTRTGTHSDLFD
jgi:mRNA interferase YafQ